MIAQANVPSVRLRDVSRNAEAESRSARFAAARAFEAVERLEDLVDLALRYSGTVVAYSNGQQVRPFLDPNLRSFAVEDRVVDQIREAALEQLGCAASGVW